VACNFITWAATTADRKTRVTRKSPQKNSSIIEIKIMPFPQLVKKRLNAVIATQIYGGLDGWTLVAFSRAPPHEHQPMILTDYIHFS
jgi:hypothetical protein